MARYKPYSYEQTKLIPVSYDRQILPGTFEHTLSAVIDSVDIAIFEKRYDNDATGAPAYDPRILLKVILYAYSKGIIFSRRIAQCCCENFVFMALSADSRPHFTTIADFISSMKDQIVPIFRDVITLCYSEGLIGKTMFAVDGCKLSSNCCPQSQETFQICPGVRRMRAGACISPILQLIRRISATSCLLGSKLIKQLKGWKVDSSEFDSSASSFKEQWACFSIDKPSWKNQYFVSLQCYNNGETMFFGVIRDESQGHIAKRPFCKEVLDTVRKLYPSARASKWWEARTIMRSPNPDWRTPEVLWRIHSDKTVLDDIAKQFLDVAKSTEHILDKLARQK